jgi:signal transduction histidine kinase
VDNALRHSGGENVDVEVFSAPDRVELCIRDDGVGISDTAEETARRKGRIGLAQMWLRAEAVGGSLDIRSHKDQGTEVCFQWAA